MIAACFECGDAGALACAYALCPRRSLSRFASAQTSNDNAAALSLGEWLLTVPGIPAGWPKGFVCTPVHKGEY